MYKRWAGTTYKAITDNNGRVQLKARLLIASFAFASGGTVLLAVVVGVSYHP
jgi:hypothetical protein